MSKTFDKNELVLDRIRYLTASDLENKQLLFRLTSLEEPALNCTAEADEIIDAYGSTITTIYKAKKAEFSATNSLFSLGLAAEQFGAKKEIAGLKNYKYGNEVDETATITMPVSEALDIKNGKITLSYEACEDIPYIYALNNKDIGDVYRAGAVDPSEVPDTDTFLSETKDGKTVITVPSGVTGKIFVEYKYKTTKAVRVSNKASEFPRSVSLNIYAYFRDVCNDNLKYSGVIICPKAKINPEQVDIALSTTGKHAFNFKMMKDYCDEINDELFSIIVSE